MEEIPSSAEESLFYSEAESITFEDEAMKDAPQYFLAGIKFQVKQNRQDVQATVRKSHKQTGKKKSALLSHVETELKITNEKVDDLNKSYVKMGGELADLQKQLSMAISRLEKLEAEGRTGAPSSTASGPPSSAGSNQQQVPDQSWDA
eukprot:TRINITY_DN18770_c0_g1_i1.p1 TRINITY_DN18770_c0_g1~~TRINITY_DN18770_c0_g1_i1.p1  ORF type:complete len:148 (-),score=40.93 TRINITY_DN18770_c0_g1_i1:36-479(-)